MESLESTLVKSRPELWELLDQPELVREWSSSLLGAEARVEMTRREPESLIGWTAAAAEESAEIEIALEESGWGTKVSLSAEGDALNGFDSWADELLEQLSSPSKRPFSTDAHGQVG